MRLFKRILVGSFFLAACMIGQPAFAFKISKLVKIGGNLSPLKMGGKLNPLKIGGKLNPLKMGGNLSPLKIGGKLNPLKIGGNLSPLKMGGKLNPLKIGGNLSPLKMGGYGSAIGALTPKSHKKSYVGSAAIAPSSALFR